MPILNYTTSVATSKTITEIYGLLAKAKARAIMSNYDAEGCLDSISFRLETAHGLATFQLPANVQHILQVIVRDKKIPQRLRTKDQAARVAWRIVKDWLEAQLAIIEAGMINAMQAFLAYAQNDQGVTLYESLRSSQFSGLALQDTSDIKQ